MTAHGCRPHWFGLCPYLQAFKKDLLLSLEIDITRPSDVSCQITVRLNVVPDIEVSLGHLVATDRLKSLAEKNSDEFCEEIKGFCILISWFSPFNSDQ